MGLWAIQIPPPGEGLEVKSGIAFWRVTMLLVTFALVFGIPVASKSYAATSTGYVRLGNLSSVPSPVDEYVYPSGKSTFQLVHHNVAYGTVLTYEPLSAGSYTVEVRDAGASVSSKPVLSVGLTVQAGKMYTVVPLRTVTQGGQLKVLYDNLPTPAGKSLVRVIIAAFGRNYTVHCSCAPGAAGLIAVNAPPGYVSSYAHIPAGTWSMTAATGGSVKASTPITLTANTYHTVVVLDGPNNTVAILPVTDAVGAQSAIGGVGTGFGGTAPHGPGSPLLWLAVIGAGALVTLAGGLRLRRARLHRSTSGV
jgi:Domain of unknown function (DUF4397)